MRRSIRADNRSIWEIARLRTCARRPSEFRADRIAIVGFAAKTLRVSVAKSPRRPTRRRETSGD
jgi:hypothetical protein